MQRRTSRAGFSGEKCELYPDINEDLSGAHLSNSMQANSSAPIMADTFSRLPLVDIEHISQTKDVQMLCVVPVRSITAVWWSGDHTLLVTPTLHWCPDHWLSEEVIRFRVHDSFTHPMNPSVGGMHSSRWTRVDWKLYRVCDGVEVRSRCGNVRTAIWGWRDLEELVTKSLVYL